MNDQTAAFRDSVKNTYAFDSWLSKVNVPNADLVRGFYPAHRELPGYELRLRRAFQERFGGERHAVTEQFAPTGEEDLLFAVTTHEFGSVTAAHEALLDTLMRCMAPELPEAKIKGLDVGDIAYAGHGKIEEAVFFTRFNVFITIHNVGKRKGPVNEIASAVDAQILEHQQGR